MSTDSSHFWNFVFTVLSFFYCIAQFQQIICLVCQRYRKKCILVFKKIIIKKYLHVRF